MDSIRPWSHKELETTEQLSFTAQKYICIEIWTYYLKHLDKNTWNIHASYINICGYSLISTSIKPTLFYSKEFFFTFNINF